MKNLLKVVLIMVPLCLSTAIASQSDCNSQYNSSREQVAKNFTTDLNAQKPVALSKRNIVFCVGDGSSKNYLFTESFDSGSYSHHGNVILSFCSDEQVRMKHISYDECYWGENDYLKQDLSMWVTDGYGNQNVVRSSITVDDRTPPVPYVIHSHTIIIEETLIELSARDFDVGSFDNFTPPEDLTFSFSMNMHDKTLELSTESVQDGEKMEIPLEIWVTDVHGNQSVGETLLRVSVQTSKIPNLEGRKNSIENLSSLFVAPNPFTHETTLTFTAEESGEVVVQVVNSLGKVTSQKKMQVTKGKQEIVLKNEDFPGAGYYFCIISNETNKVTEKVFRLSN